MTRLFQPVRRPIGMTVSLVIAALLTLAAPAASAAAAAVEEPKEGLTDGNAALAYWQAFAAVPSGEEQAAIIDNWDKVPFDAKSLEVIEASAYALAELRRGARMNRCDWGMDYGRGPELRMPHLAKARQLARLALLRARHHFEHGKARDGVVDAVTALKLGHDAGADPILISILVQYAIESMSIDLLARHLPKLSPEELDGLAATLDELPAGDRLKEVWGTESRFMVDWFEQRLTQAAAAGGQGDADWAERVLAMPIFGPEEREKLKATGVPPLEKLREQLEAVRVYYRALEGITDVPPAEQAAKVPALEQEARRDNALGQILVPAVARAFHVRHRARAKSALFRAAIAAQRGGPERLKEPALADPYGAGPFVFETTPGGFELRSGLADETGKPVTLVVGTSSPQ